MRKFNAPLVVTPAFNNWNNSGADAMFCYIPGSSGLSITEVRGVYDPFVYSETDAATYPSDGGLVPAGTGGFLGPSDINSVFQLDRDTCVILGVSYTVVDASQPGTEVLFSIGPDANSPSTNFPGVGHVRLELIAAAGQACPQIRYRNSHDDSTALGMATFVDTNVALSTDEVDQSAWLANGRHFTTFILYSDGDEVRCRMKTDNYDAATTTFRTAGGLDTNDGTGPMVIDDTANQAVIGGKIVKASTANVRTGQRLGEETSTRFNGVICLRKDGITDTAAEAFADSLAYTFPDPPNWSLI